jgi:hypothetical protein
VYDLPMTFMIPSGRWVGLTGCPAKSSTKGGHPTGEVGRVSYMGSRPVSGLIFEPQCVIIFGLLFKWCTVVLDITWAAIRVLSCDMGESRSREVFSRYNILPGTLTRCQLAADWIVKQYTYRRWEQKQAVYMA